MSRRRNAALLSVCLLAAIGIAGCSGGSAKVEANTVSVGQELQDLDAARNKGLITEQEYQDKRKDIMKRK